MGLAERLVGLDVFLISASLALLLLGPEGPGRWVTVVAATALLALAVWLLHALIAALRSERTASPPPDLARYAEATTESTRR